MGKGETTRQSILSRIFSHSLTERLNLVFILLSRIAGALLRKLYIVLRDDISLLHPLSLSRTHTTYITHTTHTRARSRIFLPSLAE